MIIPRFTNFNVTAPFALPNIPFADRMEQTWLESRQMTMVHLGRNTFDYANGYFSSPEAQTAVRARNALPHEQLAKIQRDNLAALEQGTSHGTLREQIETSRELAVVMHQAERLQGPMVDHWSHPKHKQIPVLTYRTIDDSVPITSGLLDRSAGVLTSYRGEWGFDFASNADVIHLAGSLLEVCVTGFVEEAIQRFLNDPNQEKLRLILHTAFLISRESPGNRVILKDKFAKNKESYQVKRLHQALSILTGRFVLSSQPEHPNAQRKSISLVFR